MNAWLCSIFRVLLCCVPLYPPLLLSQSLKQSGLFTPSSLHILSLSDILHMVGPYKYLCIFLLVILTTAPSERTCVCCVLHKHPESCDSPNFDACDMQGISKWCTLPIHRTTPHCSHCHHQYWGMHQAKFLGLWWSLTERRSCLWYLLDTVPWYPQRSHKKLLPVFLATLGCCVNCLAALLKGCLLGFEIS